MTYHSAFHPVRLFVPGMMAVAIACGGSDVQTPNPGPVDEGEPAVAGCRDATVGTTGALYRLCFPPSWNGDLIVYAHGYVSAAEPLAVPDDRVDGQSVADNINALGYAYAATSYRANGLVADLAVDDVTQLVEEVRRRVRPDPVRTYVVGVSEGGLVAALAAELHPDVFDGAVAACGPVGDFVAQIDYFGDFRVLFDYYFPGVIPGDPMDVPDSVRTGWDTRYAPAVVTALQSNTPAALELLSVSGAPHDPNDLATVGATVLGVLWYDVFALSDARVRLGGQPYDNIGRVYHGSANDAALNRDVARIAADPDARAGLQGFQTSGSLTVPVATIQTSGDPIVPAAQQSTYAQKVEAAGASSFLDTVEVERYGHCNFQRDELLNAFAWVVGRVPAAARID